MQPVWLYDVGVAKPGQDHPGGVMVEQRDQVSEGQNMKYIFVDDKDGGHDDDDGIDEGDDQVVEDEAEDWMVDLDARVDDVESDAQDRQRHQLDDGRQVTKVERRFDAWCRQKVDVRNDERTE